MALFSLQDKRLSPWRLAAISSLKKKKKIVKRTERIGLSAAERVQVHYPSWAITPLMLCGLSRARVCVYVHVCVKSPECSLHLLFKIPRQFKHF